MWWRGCRWKRREVSDRRMRDGDQVQGRDAGQIGTQTGVLAVNEAQRAIDAGFAQVGVDQKRLVTKLRERYRQVYRRGRLPLARQRAERQDGLPGSVRPAQRSRRRG